MSVIRKYQNPAGPLPISLGEFMGNIMKENKFSERTPKDKLSAKQSMEEAFKKFEELYELEGDNVKNILKIDPITNTYTVDTSKLKNEELKAKGDNY